MKKFLMVVFFISLGYMYTALAPKTAYTFYHWKANYNVESSEETSALYIKVLDIAFAKTLEFRKTSFQSVPSKGFIPVVYMDNPLWSKMRAQTMVTKVLNALKELPSKAYSEIQVDCDWTDGSKERYFTFLELLKKQSAKHISVTIRLHQVKYYTRTGVPPVDYGVLMYYNMSDFKDIETKNYILDITLAKQYHYNFDSYPLTLNLALPLYSQATIMRFSKVVGLIEGVREHELEIHFKKLTEHVYEVTKTHYFKERLLYEGDKVRIDEVSFEMLQESINALSKVMKQPKEVIFYRWGNRHNYKAEKLKEIVESW